MISFKLVELREVTNNNGDSRIMLKLFCEQYDKGTTTLGDFVQEDKGQLTYYMFVNSLPAGYEIGVQKEPKVIDIEHYYEGSGVWKPVNYNVVERKTVIEGTEYRLKTLKSL